MPTTLPNGYTYPELALGGFTYPVYADVAFATRYQVTRPFNKAWQGASPEDKAEALVMGTYIVDSSFIWKGYRITGDQPLNFPRTGLYFDANGNSIDPDNVPFNIKRAAAEQALELLRDGDIISTEAARNSAGGTSGETVTGEIDSIKAGSIQVSYRDSTTTTNNTNTRNSTLTTTGSYLSQYVTNLVQQFVDRDSITSANTTNPTKPPTYIVNISRLVRA